MCFGFRVSRRAISDEAVGSLGARLSETVLSVEAPAPAIRLHGYAITPDGSMILTFTEVVSSQSSVASRQSSVASLA